MLSLQDETKVNVVKDESTEEGIADSPLDLSVKETPTPSQSGALSPAETSRCSNQDDESVWPGTDILGMLLKSLLLAF